MTEKQKLEIERMRLDGIPYGKIADILGLSRNTVKSFCRRASIKKSEQPLIAENVCKNCGKELVQREKIKKRKFCSLECKTAWWNSHPEAVNRKANYELRCASCGKSFISYGNKGRKYCSHGCYINARFKGISLKI